MNLAKEISFLLYKHNCVILPGFGAFLVNEKKAERNEAIKYALPQQEVVSFNKQIINNDGLIANHLSQTLGCTYEQGTKNIEEYIDQLWVVLRSKRNVEVAEVGTFYYTKEDKLIFVPYHSVNFSTKSFGLPKLRLKQLSITKQTITQFKEESAEIIKPTPSAVVVKPEVKRKESRPTVVNKKDRIEKNQDLQANRLQKKKTEKSRIEKSRSYSLSFVNTLGTIFLVGMAAAILFFETNNNYSSDLDLQIASILDTPISQSSSDPIANPDHNITKVSNQRTISFYGIYALTENNEEAAMLMNSLLDKYSQTEIEINENNKSTVFIISFSSKELAEEYKNLIQNKINQKLVIKQK